MTWPYNLGPARPLEATALFSSSSTSVFLSTSSVCHKPPLRIDPSEHSTFASTQPRRDPDDDQCRPHTLGRRPGAHCHECQREQSMASRNEREFVRVTARPCLAYGWLKATLAESRHTSFLRCPCGQEAQEATETEASTKPRSRCIIFSHSVLLRAPHSKYGGQNKSCSGCVRGGGRR
ncbi:hypothetical protein BJ322DRAFT_340970 [Thelephora terrestris]|uniref:Uncharacterized protein n=1 Tax=Thelephora terrestris TaxID=56493 RepID=A0A9P6H896_9AGAM|nr:hypothetical protein BJ322DRAFT_340970 [Thelephora terrestris]